MALRLAFIGCNEEETRRYFAEFKEINQDQIWGFDPINGFIRMVDGTTIYRVSDIPSRVAGSRFDQIIVACDRRGVWNWSDKRLELLQGLYRQAWRHQVPEEDTVLIYEIDAGGEDRI